MNVLELFAGAGGGILHWIADGHRVVGAVESEPYCQRVLSARMADGSLPWFPVYGDVCAFDGRPYRGVVDCVSGGFPCQDISSAGKGAGINGARSGLWSEFVRVVREVGPRWWFVENSPVLTARGLGHVLGDMATLGYHATWCVLGAQHVGAPHVRERIWILAHSTGQRHGWRLSQRATSKPAAHGNRAQDPFWCASREAVALESSLERVPDGMANRLDRVRSIGNGQVPQCAALAFRTLRARLMPETTGAPEGESGAS